MFNELIRAGECQGENPLGKIRRVRESETELSFLDDGQLLALFDALTQSRQPHAYRVALLCLTTGARWSEAQDIQWRHVKAESVSYVDTKNSRNRTLPIGGCMSRQFERQRDLTGMFDRPFPECYGAFKSAWKRSGIETPKGQLSHVLRHTFASHFMQHGGNILTLSKALGHTDIKMTMRYSHLAPEHMNAIRELSPIPG